MSDSSQQKTAFEVWSFPFLESSLNTIELSQSAEPDEPAEIFDGNALLVDEAAIEHNQNLEEENAKLKEQINYLDVLGLQMKQVLSELDVTLLNNLLTLIKTSVKKIVLKEISMDENAIKDMIADSLSKINNSDELCVVHISEEDYAIFEKSEPLNHVVIKIDPTLVRGDYIIKTKYSQLDAILEQRLNRLFGI